MLKLLMSPVGMWSAGAVFLALVSAIGVQSMRLATRSAQLTVASAEVAVCKADNARLAGEIQQSLDAIEAQNIRLRLLRAEIEEGNAKAGVAVKAALKASQRDVRKPADVGTLNKRLAELFE